MCNYDGFSNQIGKKLDKTLTPFAINDIDDRIAKKTLNDTLAISC